MEESPPSRAAWIEIRFDRKLLLEILSPPSRAAWIEILDVTTPYIADKVAAFTGGVD